MSGRRVFRSFRKSGMDGNVFVMACSGVSSLTRCLASCDRK